MTRDEGEILCGSRDPDDIAEGLPRDHAEVVVKPGDDGADWRGPAGASCRAQLRRRGSGRVPAAAPAGPVVDSTGDGDAFAAALLAARRAGDDPGRALARASALAAEAVTLPGARPGA